MVAGELFAIKPSRNLIQKVLVVGNGAVENGDGLVWDVIRSYGGADAAIHARMDYGVPLAFYAANIRTIRNSLIKTLIRTAGQYRADTCVENAWSKFSEAEELRKKVGAVFGMGRQAGAPPKSKLRAELERYCPDIENDGVGVITINWDELLWQRGGLNLIQLHGRATHPNSLILPMEQIQDGSLCEDLQLIEKPKLDHAELDRAFRGECRAWLREAETLAFQWIEFARELVIYGVAMNPYDAELFQVLRRWNSMAAKGYKQTRINGRRNLTVINPNRQHADSAARLLCVSEYMWIDPLSGVRYEVSNVGNGVYRGVEC